MIKYHCEHREVKNMKKRIYYISIIVIALFPIFTEAMELPSLYSKKVLLYDMSEKDVLYEAGGDDVSNIASLTKIMTTITAIENIDDLEKKIVIDESILKEIPYDASVAGLKMGDEVTYRDLLYASILPSGADATVALAHNIAGSTKGFVEKMNDLARKLDLKSTHFANVTGYDIPNHYSTANEVLKILLYSLENPLFKEIYESKQYTLTNGLEVKSTLNFYNKFLQADISSIIGSKTGYTSKSGMCMSAIIETGGREIILITLGAPYSYTYPYNLKDTLNVINYLDKNYRETVLFEEGKELFTLPVVGSKEETYSVRVPTDIIEYTEVDYDPDSIWFDYNGLEELSYKNIQGKKIGEISFYHGKKLLVNEDVFLTEKLHFSLYKFVSIHKMEVGMILIVVAIAFAGMMNKKQKKRRKIRKS